MSQQINLLPRPPAAPAISAKRALLGLGLWIVVQGAYAQWQQIQSQKAQQAALKIERQLHAQQAILSTLQRKLGETGSPNDIAAQIAALEPQTRVSKDLLTRLESGELGSLGGYAPQLTAMAGIRQQGVWLTAIAITNAGRSLRVEGRALQKEQILFYARNLNDAMVPFRAQVSEVDIAPVATAPDEKPAAPLFAFKLF